jgi:hypothetical protein
MQIFINSQSLTAKMSTIVIVYNCLSDAIVFSNITTTPPPSTVSIVLASKLGVNASKS